MDKIIMENPGYIRTDKDQMLKSGPYWTQFCTNKGTFRRWTK